MSEPVEGGWGVGAHAVAGKGGGRPWRTPLRSTTRSGASNELHGPELMTAMPAGV